jgi:hypothetical protein
MLTMPFYSSRTLETMVRFNGFSTDGAVNAIARLVLGNGHGPMLIFASPGVVILQRAKNPILHIRQPNFYDLALHIKTIPFSIFIARRNMRNLTFRRSKGIAVTELAVCLPIFVLIVLATIEACSVMYLKQSLSIAAYEGARVALIKESTVLNVTSQCEAILTDRNINNPTMQISPNDFQAAPMGSFIAVQVSVPYVDNRVISLPLFAPPYIISRVEMMKEY